MRTLLLFKTCAFFLLLFSTNSFAQTIPDPEILYYKFDGAGIYLPNYALNPPAGAGIPPTAF